MFRVKFLAAFATLVSMTSVAEAAKSRVFVNIDDTHFLLSRSAIDAHPDEADIRAFVGQYAGSDVTDVMMCIAGRLSCAPSKVRMSWLDKYAQTNENGIAVDYRKRLSVLHEIWDVKKLDPYRLWIDEAHKRGIRLWLSVRMNDCHENREPASFLHSDYFHEHPEYRRVTHHPPYTYYDRNFDYGHEAVRQRLLAYLEEMMMRYGPDGLELDWLREAFCFQIGRENPQLTTGFVRQVKKIADRAAKKFGHPIPLAVRVPPDPTDAFDFGFDVGKWAEEGLVSVVSPCARWATTNMDIPVTVWRRILHGTGTVLAPGVELLIRPSSGAKPLVTDEAHVYASAACYYSFGADGVSLYNYFDDPAPDFRPYWGRPTAEYADKSVFPEVLKRILGTLGSPQKVLSERRLHMLTWNDIRPVGRSAYEVLPYSIKRDRLAVFRVPVGRVLPGQRVELRLGARIAGDVPPTVYVNSRPATYLRLDRCTPLRVEEPLFLYSLDGFAESTAVIEVMARADTRVTFCEVAVSAVGK